MLAQLLRRYYLFQALLGAALGWAVAPAVLPLALWLPLAALLWIALLQWTVLALSMVLSTSRGDAPSAVALALRWRALWREFRAALVVYLLRQTWARRNPGVQAPLGGMQTPAPQPGTPVVLVHGYLCNHRVWDDVARALRRAGHPVLAVDLEPLFTSIDDYASLIARAVSDLQAATGAARVALVGHSMGGLAIRAWLRSEGPARVECILTLGSPHQGTRVGHLAATPNGVQMAWHSDWLQALAAHESAAERALMHLAITPIDTIVYPQRAQGLDGAQLTEFNGLGHLEMCLDPGVIAWVLKQLAPPASASAEPAAHGASDAQHPDSVRTLYWAFSLLALQGFGGVVAIVQRELVDRRRWLTREQFVEDWAVAQVLPGANVVNLSLMIGDRYFGWRGSLAALAGLLSLPLLIVLLLAVLFAGISDQPAVQGALRGMGAVAAGMITATGLKLVPSLASNVLGRVGCSALAALSFVAIALLHLPLVWVLLGVGGAAALVAHARLGRAPSKAGER